MKRTTWAVLVLLVLTAAHVAYWYLPRERAVAPRLDQVAAAQLPPAGAGVGAGGVQGNAGQTARGAVPAAGEAVPSAGGAQVGDGDRPIGPRELLAGGAYDVCVWIPYPHQNLGVLAAAVGDLPEVIAAAARLAHGAESGAAAAGGKAAEPLEVPAFGPFEVPPASELTACADLAGGRMRLAARIYPSLAVVAKLAGHLAGNPWLAGGAAGRMRVAWDGRLWNVAAGSAVPPPRRPGADPAGAAGGAGDAGSAGGGLPELPESLAVVHWRGERLQIPTGYYTLTRQDADLVLALAGGAPGAASAATLPGVASAGAATLLVAVGPGWKAEGAAPSAAASALEGDAAPDGSAVPSNAMPEILFPSNGAPPRASGRRRRGGTADPSGGQAGADRWAGAPPPKGEPEAGYPKPGGPAVGSGSPQAGGPAARPGTLGGPVPPASPRTGGAAPGTPGAPAASLRRLPPAAMALFETGGSRLTSLGDLPGLAVFNVAPAQRWHLPAESVFRFFSGHMPSADVAGWHVVALDAASLRQATALAPRLAALVPPVPAAGWAPGGGATAAGSPAAGRPAAAGESGGGAATAGVAGRGAATADAPGGGVATAGAVGRGAATAGAVGRGAATAGAVGRGAATAGAVGRGAATAGAAGAGAVTAGVTGGGAPTAGGARVSGAALPPMPGGGGAAVEGAGEDLSLGVWLDPAGAYRLVSRIRKFVEDFPLASRGEVALWRDWETVLDPLANCDRASLDASVESPHPRLRLVLQSCSLAHR